MTPSYKDFFNIVFLYNNIFIKIQVFIFSLYSFFPYCKLVPHYDRQCYALIKSLYSCVVTLPGGFLIFESIASTTCWGFNVVVSIIVASCAGLRGESVRFISW